MESASLTLGGSVSVDDKYVPVHGGSKPVSDRPVPVNSLFQLMTSSERVWKGFGYGYCMICSITSS